MCGRTPSPWFLPVPLIMMNTAIPARLRPALLRSLRAWESAGLLEPAGRDAFLRSVLLNLAGELDSASSARTVACPDCGTQVPAGTDPATWRALLREARPWLDRVLPRARGVRAEGGSGGGSGGVWDAIADAAGGAPQ